MISGIFHSGSGLGNMLHRYVATRVLALDKGYEWSMMNPENFKGSSFMDLEIPPLGNDAFTFWNEKKVVENDVDIRGYDPEFNFIEDHTIIDGEFQDPRYFEHHLDKLYEWLDVDLLRVPDDVCVIGFRGGEFSGFPDLFLTKEYWSEAIEIMKGKGVMKFQVHTDDVTCAAANLLDLLPTDTIYKHDIGINWRSMRFARYAIIANSSFFILPRLLSKGITIAPRYWARRNTKVWSMASNFYKQFTYI